VQCEECEVEGSYSVVDDEDSKLQIRDGVPTGNLLGPEKEGVRFLEVTVYHLTKQNFPVQSLVKALFSINP
jgi:hypothetical protein